VTQQKLVTLYLDSEAYEGEGFKALFNTNKGSKHGHLEEHLKEDLAKGWRIVELSSISAGEVNARGWFAVVLEK
jgi:hypothetical protein